MDTQTKHEALERSSFIAIDKIDVLDLDCLALTSRGLYYSLYVDVKPSNIHWFIWLRATRCSLDYSGNVLKMITDD